MSWLSLLRSIHNSCASKTMFWFRLPSAPAASLPLPLADIVSIADIVPPADIVQLADIVPFAGIVPKADTAPKAGIALNAGIAKNTQISRRTMLWPICLKLITIGQCTAVQGVILTGDIASVWTNQELCQCAEVCRVS